MNNDEHKTKSTYTVPNPPRDANNGVTNSVFVGFSGVNPDLSIGLSAASTPDADNPNHEWRDGKKYAKGTSIEIVEKITPKPSNFIASAWGIKS